MESLSTLAFHTVGTKVAVNGLSIFQYACIHRCDDIVKMVLKFGPNIVDLVHVLRSPIYTSPYESKTLLGLLESDESGRYIPLIHLLKEQCHGCVDRHLLFTSARYGTVNHIRKYAVYGELDLPSFEYCEEVSTVLNLAAEYNSIDVIDELISLGASLTTKDYQGYNPIHFAARSGRKDVVLYMIAKYLSLRDVIGHTYTPLHLAAWNGHLDTVTTLLNLGADINTKGNHLDVPDDEARKRFYIERGQHIWQFFKLANMPVNISHITPLMLSAQNNHIDVFEYLKENGALYDSSLLLYAVKSANPDFVKRLIKEGLNIEVRDTYTADSLLHIVVHPETAELFIKLGLNVNCKNRSEETPLHVAAISGNTILADVFIRYGANVFAKDSAGHTPIMSALLFHQPFEVISYFVKKTGNIQFNSDINPLILDAQAEAEVIQTLIDGGCDVNWIDPDTGDTALHHFASYGLVDSVKTLLLNGACHSIPNKEGYLPLHFAVRIGNAENLRVLLAADNSCINSKISYGRTALHLACYPAHNVEIVDVLLEYGVDITAKSNKGNTVLHKAISGYQSGWGNDKNELGVIKTLLQSEKGVELLDMQNNKKQTALHIAVSLSSYSAVKVLLDFGCNIDCVDACGDSPLHYSVRLQSDEVFFLLVKAGANLFLHGNKTNSLLHSCANHYYGSKGAIDYIFDNDLADVNAVNTDNRTTLHLCVRKSNRYLFVKLLKRDINIDAIDIYGRTVLHYLSLKPSNGMLQLLLEKKPSLNVVDYNGWTCLHHAASVGCHDNFELLLYHGCNSEIKNKDGKKPNDLRSEEFRKLDRSDSMYRWDLDYVETSSCEDWNYDMSL